MVWGLGAAVVIIWRGRPQPPGVKVFYGGLGRVRAAEVIFLIGGVQRPSVTVV